MIVVVLLKRYRWLTKFPITIFASRSKAVAVSLNCRTVIKQWLRNKGFFLVTKNTVARQSGIRFTGDYRGNSYMDGN